MRVLYLNTGGQMGGAETSLVELLTAVRQSNPTWDLRLLLAGNGPLAGKVKQMGISVQILSFPPPLAKLGDSGNCGRPRLIWNMLRAAWDVKLYLRELAKHIRLVEPDLIHATGFKMQALAAQCRPAAMPLLWHIHDYISARPIMSRAMAFYSRRCSAAIANSNSVAKDVRTLCGTRLPITTVYNAIDLKRFSPRGAAIDLDAASGLPPAPSGTVRVGLIATFARWKGHEVFLKALSLLPPSTAVRGYIIGGPIYNTEGSQYTLEDLRAVVDRLGLSEKVGFAGFMTDPAAAMRALHVVVHASTQPEPFGMVIVEGMACGKAVIASSAGGAAEIVQDGTSALTHVPGDAQGLANQILRAALDPELRASLGANGRVTAERLCGRARLAGELKAIYANVSPVVQSKPSK